MLTRRAFFLRSALAVLASFGFPLPNFRKRAFAATPGTTGNRVVWVHDENATSWTGSGYYGKYVDQSRINAMLMAGIRELTGRTAATDAWRAIIPDYVPGKVVAIKVNINNGSTGNAIDAMAVPIISLISGLKSIGVLETDIHLVEPSNEFSPRIGDPIRAAFPNVVMWDGAGTYGQLVTFDYGTSANTTIHHSNPGLTGDNAYSYMPEQLGDCSYLINMPIMKGHGGAEISLSFKNCFGLLKRYSIAKLHDFALPYRSQYSYDMNPLHDIYLNTNVRNKTVLIVGDGFFCSRRETAGTPEPWNTFGGKFPNSLFLSTDPVAIDSVMFDFLNAEVPRADQSQLYLHRAMELGLGTHEHWNSAADKTYSNIDFRKVDLTNGGPVIKVPMPPTNLHVVGG